MQEINFKKQDHQALPRLSTVHG